MEDQKVKELAQTLKNSGLAASDYEAIEKAKAILGTKIQKEENEQELEIPKIKERLPEKTEQKEGFISHLTERLHHEKKPELVKHRFSQPDYDVSKEELTVNDLMREIGVNPEEITEEKEKIKDVEEKISEVKAGIIEEGKKPEKEKIGEIRNQIEDIKEELQEIEKAEEDKLKEEKKIDLSKVFDFSGKQ